jgi:hypothetical protein
MIGTASITTAKATQNQRGGAFTVGPFLGPRGAGRQPPRDSEASARSRSDHGLTTSAAKSIVK